MKAARLGKTQSAQTLSSSDKSGKPEKPDILKKANKRDFDPYNDKDVVAKLDRMDIRSEYIEERVEYLESRLGDENLSKKKKKQIQEKISLLQSRLGRIDNRKKPWQALADKAQMQQPEVQAPTTDPIAEEPCPVDCMKPGTSQPVDGTTPLEPVEPTTPIEQPNDVTSFFNDIFKSITSLISEIGKMLENFTQPKQQENSGQENSRANFNFGDMFRPIFNVFNR